MAIKPEKESYQKGEIAYININIEDATGNVECNDDRNLCVKVDGAELLGFGSANPCTEEDYLSGSFKTYYGRSQAIVRVGDKDSFTVTVNDGKSDYEKTITVK